MVVDKTYDQVPMWIKNAETNKALLSRHKPMSQEIPPLGLPILIAGGGPSLNMDCCRKATVFANQSSAPYIRFHQVPVSYIVITDGNKAVRERMDYLFRPDNRDLYRVLVATHVDPKMLMEMEDRGWSIEYFLHSDFANEELTKGLVKALPDGAEGFPMISMVGSVGVASIIVANLKFPTAPSIYLSGLDFGYPKEFSRRRVPDIRKIGLGPEWAPLASQDPGPFMKVFGYETSPQHLEYYQQLRYVQPAIKAKLYTVHHGILEDIMEYRELPC